MQCKQQAKHKLSMWRHMLHCYKQCAYKLHKDGGGPGQPLPHTGGLVGAQGGADQAK